MFDEIQEPETQLAISLVDDDVTGLAVRLPMFQVPCILPYSGNEWSNGWLHWHSLTLRAV